MGAIVRGSHVQLIPSNPEHRPDLGYVVRTIPNERAVLVRWEHGPIREHIVQDLVLLSNSKAW